jgi:GNAT superfamily N-acetyltransferase
MHTIGPAKEKDLPSVLKLFRRVNAQLSEEGNLMWSHGYPSPEVFQEDIANHRLYLVKEGTRVLAMGAVSHDITDDFFSQSRSQKKTQDVLDLIGWKGEPICLLHRFMSDPAFWGKGVAAELWDYLERRYKGSTWVFAAYCRNEKALAFYRKHGFTVHGIYRDFEWGEDSVQILISKKYQKDGLCLNR